ncbi:ATP-dependent helicase HrpB [Alteromonas flava]|uniref:ATP-dependent helicase HrpB n=1 Tax=Alteromonas flava TaxID=2048003 RepID=UPI0013D920E5|nr:ATP-dependent helicase HrpB [Alteromonas flava]
MALTELPIQQHLPTLTQRLVERNVILTAAPGAGKSTELLLYLLKHYPRQGKIVVLQPRRVVVRALAEYLANRLGESVGQRVGYQIRGERKISAETRLEFITEGILARRIQHDPELTNVSVLVFDEFHERNIHSDFGFALALDVQQALREDLRLLVMSATLLTDTILPLLQPAHVLEVEGRQFPITYHYNPITTQPLNTQQLSMIIVNALIEHTGDILVFLPGQREIEATLHTLQSKLSAFPTVKCLPLYGALGKAVQEQALAEPKEGQRKVILATNIAETSLTIEGVRVVIDTGLERQFNFSLALGTEKISTRQIAQDSAAQRAGRAGRTGPGVCYRLWPEEQQGRLPKARAAEILQRDISDLYLQALAWGCELRQLALPTAPTPNQCAHAREVLRAIGAIDEDGKLTQHGKAIARVPLNVRLAHMMCTLQTKLSAKPELLTVAAVVAQILDGSEVGQNVWLTDFLSSSTLGRLSQQLKAAERLCKTLGIQFQQNWLNAVSSEFVAEIVAMTFPDRVAKLMAGSEYKLANGKRAYFKAADNQRLPDWLAIAQMVMHTSGKLFISSAQPIDFNRLTELFNAQIQDSVEFGWDDKTQKLTLSQVQRLSHISITSQPIDGRDGDYATQIMHAWETVIQRNGIDWLPISEAGLILLNRMRWARLLCQRDALLPFPDMRNEALLADLKEWLLPHISAHRSRKSLANIDWSQLFQNQLDWPQLQWLERAIPTHFQLPSGDRLVIEYPPCPQYFDAQSQLPSISAPMQWLYGFEQSPSVAEGRLALQIELLSPARRVLQKTRDLATFWQSESYQQIKKEMRGRYPKHLWPDDPANTSATKVTKKRMQAQSQ